MRADLRRVVVRPGGDQHRADALRDDRDVLDRDAVGRRDVVDEASARRAPTCRGSGE